MDAKRAARFWAKVHRGEGCWEWRGATTPNGYGNFYVGGGRFQHAHRVSWRLAHAGVTLSSDDFICHRCDNPICVRPDHLFLGDAQANVDDMIAKGRRVQPVRRRGERHHNATLTDAMVVAIRERVRRGENQMRIARELGFRQDTINKAVIGVNFSHLPGAVPRGDSRGRRRFITIDGIERSVSEWAAKTGLKRTLIIGRLHDGWSERDAVLTPAGGRA